MGRAAVKVSDVAAAVAPGGCHFWSVFGQDSLADSRLGSNVMLASFLECPGRPGVTSRVWRVVLLGVLLTMVAACSQSAAVKKQKAFDRGEAYLKSGKFNEAIIELRNALQVDPGFVPALHALGRAYAAKSWFVDAWRE